MIWFCFCFDFVGPHAQCDYCSIVCWRGWGVPLKLDVQGHGVEKILDIDGQGGGGGVFKIINFKWQKKI